MKKRYIIKSINDYDYILDNGNEDYLVNIEFYNIVPKIGDIIYIDDKLVNEKVLNIGLLDSKYGLDITDISDNDFIFLESSGKKYYLKRIYG